MGFSAEVGALRGLVLTRTRDLVTQAGLEVQRSMVEGSEITGAPGQPVDTGALKASWIPERPDDFAWRTTTNKEYAPGIEAGIGPNGPITLRSAVGGFHSRAKTIEGWPRIAEVARQRVVKE